jgi:hypothetical protein
MGVRRHDDEGCGTLIFAKSHIKLMAMCIIVYELRIATIIAQNAINVYKRTVGGEVGRQTTRKLSQTSLSPE